MKNLICFLVLLSCLSCSNREEAYFKNQLLINEIDSFIDSAQSCGITHKDRYILMFWDKFENDTNSISLHMTKPASFKDLYCVINYKDYKILVYADFDLSKYVYTKNAYDVDTSDLVTTDNLGVNWFSSGFFFDGVKTYNPSSVINEASFPEGEMQFVDFLLENIKYPQTAIENKIEGQVIVIFDISKTGKISNIEILRGIGYECDKEVLQAIEKISFINPKTIFKKPIESSSVVRITFIIDNKSVVVESSFGSGTSIPNNVF